MTPPTQQQMQDLDAKARAPIEAHVARYEGYAQAGQAAVRRLEEQMKVRNKTPKLKQLEQVQNRTVRKLSRKDATRDANQVIVNVLTGNLPAAWDRLRLGQLGAAVRQDLRSVEKLGGDVAARQAAWSEVIHQDAIFVGGFYENSVGQPSPYLTRSFVEAQAQNGVEHLGLELSLDPGWLLAGPFRP